MVATHFLKTRVTPETKARVSAIAHQQLLTESIWLRRLIIKALHEQESESTSQKTAERHDGVVTEEQGQCSRKRGQASRLFVKIRTEDQLLLRERAGAQVRVALHHVQSLVA
jgi:hypothetical protein